jgi:hypothetical protein
VEAILDIEKHTIVYIYYGNSIYAVHKEQHNQQLGHILMEQESMKQELKHITNKHKALENKYSDLLMKTTSLKERVANFQENTLTKEPEPSTPPVTNIPTQNRFQQLKDQPKLNSDDPEKQHPENTPPPTSNDLEEIQADNVIICDSNGRHLNPKLLCPNAQTKYVRCPTLSEANEITEKTKFTSLKTIIIHTGTNDLEHPAQSEAVTLLPSGPSHI